MPKSLAVPSRRSAAFFSRDSVGVSNFFTAIISVDDQNFALIVDNGIEKATQFRTAGRRGR
jgi:hypothetical protein